MTVKCYMGNLDGKLEGLVVAENQKRAAEIAGTTLYDFRRYWSAQSPWPIPNAKIHTLYTRAYGARQMGEWVLEDNDDQT
jgi:hypothetical protein